MLQFRRKELAKFSSILRNENWNRWNFVSRRNNIFLFRGMPTSSLLSLPTTSSRCSVVPSYKMFYIWTLTTYCSKYLFKHYDNFYLQHYREKKRRKKTVCSFAPLYQNEEKWRHFFFSFSFLHWYFKINFFNSFTISKYWWNNPDVDELLDKRKIYRFPS